MDFKFTTIFHVHVFLYFYIYLLCIFFIVEHIDLDFRSMRYIKIDIINIEGRGYSIKAGVTASSEVFNSKY